MHDVPFLKTSCKITHLCTHLQTKRNKTSVFPILKIYNQSKNIQISTFSNPKIRSCKTQEQEIDRNYKILTAIMERNRKYLIHLRQTVKLLTISNHYIMKRIFVIITCAAFMMACGGNKAQNSECGERKTECCEKKECKKQDCDKQECKKKCEKKCDKQECDNKCKEQECKKECSKQQCEKKCDKQAAGSIHLDADGFASKVADLSKEWKYLGDKPAVVDFYADWCGPCRAIAPFLEEIAQEYDGQLYIYKVNVDEAPEIANAFNISAIPTLLFIPMEGRYKVQTGGMPKEDLVKLITENCF